MPEISIPEDLYRQLADRANALNKSVEALVEPTLRQFVVDVGPFIEGPRPLTGEAWRREWEAWKRDAEKRAGRYPPGFQVDDSRETMYFGRDESER